MFPKEEHPGLNRVRHQLRSVGTNEPFTHPQLNGIHSRGYLPHVKHEGADYFVTFRLADSLPREVLLRLKQEREDQLRRLKARDMTPGIANRARSSATLEFYRKVERYLDRGLGACHLRDPEIAALVTEALKFFDRNRYVLRDWVVMPNHVHVLFWPMPNHSVGAIVKSWKQFTSLRAKSILGLHPGRFWQPEAYDHWVRNETERSTIARYIRNNPVTARLCAHPEDWRWSSAWRGPSM